jgi:hypothetical protein
MYNILNPFPTVALTTNIRKGQAQTRQLTAYNYCYYNYKFKNLKKFCYKAQILDEVRKC